MRITVRAATCAAAIDTGRDALVECGQPAPVWHPTLRVWLCATCAATFNRYSEEES